MGTILRHHRRTQGMNMTTKEAALRTGYSVINIQQSIARGKLKATKHGRDWDIMPTDLEAFMQSPRKVGFPKGRKRK